MAKPDSHQQCEKLLLSHWGLPKPVLAAFASKGLTELYPWQAAALECAAAGNNLVYCAPTSGGKSLVAEVVMLSRMHQAQQALHQAQQGSHRQAGALPRGLLVLPYLSIVAEKTAHLSLLLEGMKWRVTGYKGEEQGTPLAGKSERIAICSIEKANMAINHLIQEQRLHELVSVVVDEAHMLADPHRGAALEMLLSKLVACRGRCSVQVVAMSATMSGLDSLSAWLGGHLFLTNFRPVPLSEHAVFGGTVYAKAGQTSGGGSDANDWPLVEQRRLPVQGKSDRDALLALVAEVVVESHSVLVFCAGRAAAQSCAAMLAGELGRLVGPPSAAQAAARAELVAELRVALAGGVNAELERMMAAGVAYHHAGLTHQERGVVEAGYRSGALLALTATSTLAAGVNLPARRVILRSLWQGAGPVGRAQYLQMVGRAGRAGQSPVGESFLMGQGAAGSATSGQWAAVCALMSAPLPALCSQLVAQPSQQPAASMGQPSGSGGQAAGSGPAQPQPAAAPLPGPECNAQPSLQQLLLHAVAAGLVGTGPSVLSLLQSTLSYHQLPFADLADAARSALTALRARRLLSLKPEGPSRPSAWELTPLGEAVVASMLPPDLGLLLHSRMSNLMSCLVLGGHLHLLFMLQPDPLLAIYDWNAWARLTKDFTAAHKRVADVEGVQLSYIDRRIAGMRGDAATDAKHARLAGAVLLDMVVGDASCVHSLEGAWGQPNGLTKAGITRGQMQQWQAEVSKTAAMAALLASNAGWWQLEALLAPLSAQAAAGVRPELLPLMEVSGMQPSHAAALHAAGYLRPELLVCAAESEIAAALAAKLPANPLKRKDNDKKKQQGLGGYGTNALVARAAKSLLAAARQHVVLAATAKAADAELGGTQVDAFSLTRRQLCYTYQAAARPVRMLSAGAFGLS
uniref:DNA-directed DNA polymerase n=1 Tax=Tetradesmus obliquus TaxID=3088 RepID=A0A383VNY9_TETOB|eukprot:jgi/Sobl393_1/15991/SZX66472.1